MISSAIFCFQMMFNDGEFSDMTMWLTLEEAAKHLKIGKSTIYRLAREGDLPHIGWAGSGGLTPKNWTNGSNLESSHRPEMIKREPGNENSSGVDELEQNDGQKESDLQQDGNRQPSQ